MNVFHTSHWIDCFNFYNFFYLFHDTDRPVCRSDQKRIYGVARNENAKISCEVDAYPAPTSFKWSFNNTAETIDMPQNGYEQHTKTSSRLTYTPVKVRSALVIFPFRSQIYMNEINGFMAAALLCMHKNCPDAYTRDTRMWSGKFNFKIVSDLCVTRDYGLISVALEMVSKVPWIIFEARAREKLNIRSINYPCSVARPLLALDRRNSVCVCAF